MEGHSVVCGRWMWATRREPDWARNCIVVGSNGTLAQSIEVSDAKCDTSDDIEVFVEGLGSKPCELLEKEKVETVVITCVDALHDLYIVPALEAGGEPEFVLRRWRS